MGKPFFASNPAAHGFQIINIIMTASIKEPRYRTKSPGRGGARPGAGRPKGSSPRYTLEDLVTHIEHHAGRTFAEQVAINYANAIGREDHAGVRDYDKILLGKMVADKQEIEVVENEDVVEAKKTAFAEALADLVGKKKS